jgi:LysM repeat protein
LPERAPQKTQMECGKEACFRKSVALDQNIGVPATKERGRKGPDGLAGKDPTMAGIKWDGPTGWIAGGVAATGGIIAALVTLAPPPKTPEAVTVAPVAVVAEPAPGDAVTEAKPAAEAALDETGADPAASTATIEPGPEATASVEPAPAVPEPTAPPYPPAFDTVRVEPDGSALVAGSAPAKAVIHVMIAGVEVGSATADDGGNFAALFDLPPSEAPRLMTLEAAMPDGTRLASTDSVAIAPTVAAVKVAKADPVPQAAEPVAEAAPEPAAPATLLVTDEGAALLNPAAGPKVEVSVDTIAYTPAGAVQMSGQGTAGETLRFYLDNAELLTVPVPESGPWSAVLPDTPPGIYTLRVDQIGADGKVTSRFETPFKRETPEALAAASGVVEEPAQPAAEEAMKAPEAAAPAEPAGEVVIENGAVATPNEPAEETVSAAEAPEPASPPVNESADAGVSDNTEAPQLKKSEPVAAAQVEPAIAAPLTVTVQPGFTLWKIARDSFGDGVMYVQVYEANKDRIRNPDLIYPGQVFTMPAMLPKAP